MEAVVVCIVLLILLIWFTSRRRDNHYMILARQMLRWYNAALQDTSPIIALLHANYAAGYLWALKDITNDSDFLRETGLVRETIERKITSVQDRAGKMALKACPLLGAGLDADTVQFA